jgi:lantibiotic modifying enzyme
MPLGGMVGLGSFIWALTRAGEWTGDAGLAEGARAGAALVTPARVAADDQLDVVAGAAGTLLALLALDDEGKSGGADGAGPLDAALRCAAHLLERRVGSPGTRAWPGADNPPLSGFAHGASGIAHALLRLYARTGRAELRDAALEGFAYERTLFHPPAGTWLDPRTGRPLEQTAWCHGAPGMALARLHAAALGVDGAEEELERCLRLTRGLSDVTLDHLCCGNAGRAEILLRAGQATGRNELVDEASGIAARMLSAATPAGHRYLPPGEPTAFAPSLFRGAAGVGYVLLRLWRPAVLPSPLLLD